MSDTDTDTETTTDTTTEQVESEAPEQAESETHSREAAKYRRQLREAETARDGLLARVEKFQTTAVETLATGPGNLLDATDLWRVTDLASVLDDAGEVDPAKVKAAVDQLLEDKPHYGAPPALVDGMDLGIRGGSLNPHDDASWADVIKSPWT